MTSTPPYKIYSCGDYAVTIDLGNVIEEEINKRVLQIFNQLKQKNIQGVRDVIPAYSSITVVYDVVYIRQKHNSANANAWITHQLENMLLEKPASQADTGTLIKIPACYEAAYAPDLAEMAAQKNMQPEEIIHLHSSNLYRVYMLGFLPGFAYMGTVDERIGMPRRATPRVKVPAGSIGIAGLQTGIYPQESPGGWNIIAQTSLKLFDVAWPTPVLLQPGDTVQFYPVTTAEFKQIRSAQ